MHRSIRGAVAGAVATIPMSAVIWAGDAVGLLRTPPPAQITANVEGKTGAGAALEPVPFSLRMALAHVAYGAGCGAVYPLIQAAWPGRPDLVGGGFGLIVWSVSYGAALPALRLYPSLRADRRTRTAVMIAAHLVYGAALGRTLDRLDRQAG